jgi:hypothetical protein
MAFQTGTQVRPELGRADVSGFARGGMAIGAGVLQGIQNYQEQKQITSTALSDLEGRMAADPSILTAMQKAGQNNPKIAKALKSLNEGDYKQNDVLTLSGFASSLQSTKAAMQADQIRNIQLQEAQSEQKEKQISRSAFDMALSASREAGTGEVNPAAFSAAYFDQGGRDPNDLKIIESMQKMKGPNLEAIEVGGFTVLTEDGEYKQSFRDGEEATPSAQRVLEFKLEERKRARELYEQGNIQEANDILAVNGYEDAFGRPQTAEQAFGPLNPTDPNNDSSDLEDAVLSNQATTENLPSPEQIKKFEDQFLPR